MSSHTIRLRDPWQYAPVSAAGSRWTRAFHRPTGLTEREQVWLIVSDSAATVWLGDQLLTASGPGPGSRYDITARLADHNRLMVEVPRAGKKRPFEACLEIRGQ